MPKAQRKPISKKVRFDVFKRDLFVCQYCGSSPPAVVLEVDHIRPVSGGGSNDKDNLITACFDCNRGKGPVGLDVAPETIAEKARILEEKQEQLKALDRLVRSQRKREEKLIDEVQEAFNTHFEGTFTAKFRQSVRVFLQKLPAHEVVNAMHLSCGRIGRRDDSLKYFCGVCWGKTREAKHGQG